jgi:hypothetical protein
MSVGVERPSPLESIPRLPKRTLELISCCNFPPQNVHLVDDKCESLLSLGTISVLVGGGEFAASRSSKRDSSRRAWEAHQALARD